MFASKSLVEHLLRGAIGISAFIAAGILASSAPLLSLALVPVALLALRGCPTCWTVGLAQTLAAKAFTSSRLRSCVHGRCTLPAQTPAQKRF
jgi:hypothetical protein